jgi:hypothetical protein
LRFCPSADEEFHFEMSRAVFQRLRDGMTAELNRTTHPSRRGS